MAPPAPSMPFIKNLASSDRKIRTQALDSLKGFLTAKYASPKAAPLTFNDAEKLWAGLFYALWMADRPRTQQRLCNEIAEIPAALKLPDASVASWLRAFWATMARQWTTGIDVLRMDKFLLLVRRVLAAQFLWMAGDDEEAEVPVDGETQNLGFSILEQWPFNLDAEAEIETESATPGKADESEGGSANDSERPRKKSRKAAPPPLTVHIPVGLVLHAVDIWVDEAAKARLLKTKTPDSDGKETLGYRINTLVETLAAKTTFPAVRQRARDSLADEQLPWNKATGAGGIEAQADSDDSGSNDGSWDGFND